MAMRALFCVETDNFTALRENSRGDLIFIIIFGYPAPRAAIEIPDLFPVQSFEFQDPVLAAVFQFDSGRRPSLVYPEMFELAPGEIGYFSTSQKSQLTDY